MKSVIYVKPDFPVDAFAGTADYYARYRVPYPRALTEHLLNRVAAGKRSRLLDLACGPGRMTLPLAPAFKEVWAIDLEPEMIEVGRRIAEVRRIANIKWLTGRAEDLDAPESAFDLISIGEAFHRLDQRLIGERALAWLSPGGGLAIAGCYGIARGSEPWQKIVADIAQRWGNRGVSSSRPAATPRPGSGPEHNRLVLSDQGFENVAAYSFVESHEWTLESIIGCHYSSSGRSRAALGDHATAFEADMADALLAHDQSGVYRADLRCGYTFGRRPRGT